MRRPGFHFWLLVMGLIAAGEGLRCYVCNSKADSRCADPIQAAEEETDGENSSNNMNSNKNSNNNNVNSNKNGNRYEERDEGLRVVDCKVAHNVRQAMDAVSELLSRLGKRVPGGGDVWAAVRASGQSSPSSSYPWSSGQGQGLAGQQGSQGGYGYGSQGGYGGPQRGQEELEANAACHKVDMEVDGEMVTDRGCAPGHVLGQEPCDALLNTWGDTEFCELCDEDGCNGAGIPGASATAQVAGVLLLHGLGRFLQHGGQP